MATYLELVNSVLKRMREPTVTSVAETASSTIVGEFINDAKRMVEDAWQWTVLSGMYYSNPTAYSYTLEWQTFFPYDYPIATPELYKLRSRARLWINPDTNETQVYAQPFGGGFDYSKANKLIPVPYSELRSMPLITSGAAGALAQYYAVIRTTAEVGSTSVYSEKAFALYPPIPPTNWPQIMAFFVNPQNDLVNASDVLYVPKEPVIQAAYVKALYERGEELGEGLSKAEEYARQCLLDAIQDDQNVQSVETRFAIPD